MKEFFHKHHYFIVTSVTMIILLFFGWQVMGYLFSLREEPEKRPPMIQARAVRTRPVAYSTVESPVLGEGRVISSREIVLTSEVRGQILESEIPVKVGQQFRRGDVLIRIFEDNASLQLRSRKSAFLQRIAGILPDMKVDYSSSYDAWKNFFDSIEIDSKLPEIPQPASEQEKVFIASRNILTDYYSIKSDEVTLDKYVITAPFDGTFTEVAMQIGAIASPGQTLARIIRTDRLEVEVPIETEDARWIEIGDSATLVSGDGQMTWNGKVVRKSAFVDETTQSVPVFVGIDNSGSDQLIPGQWVRVEFPGHPIENVMEIPRNAVFNGNEVYVVRDGRLARREVNIHKVNEETLIISGLTEGEELVIEPLVSSLENSPVEIIR